MKEMDLVKSKIVVCNTIDIRVDEINKDIGKYGELTRFSNENKKLMLSNLKTEICINLDNEFKK